MQGNLLLKRAGGEDAQALFELRYKAYLRPYALYSSPESPCLDGLETVQNMLEGEGGLEVYGLYLGRELVGGAAVLPGEEAVGIRELYVDPAQQRQGIGTQALHLLEARFPAAVYTLDNCDAALQPMLERSGYQPNKEPRMLGPRCRMQSYVKQAFQQVEILLSPLRREQLPQVENMLKSLSETELYNFSGGAYTQMPTVEALSGQLSAGKHYAGASSLEFAIEVPDYETVIGILCLTDLEWEIKRGRLCNLLIDPRWRGKGIGRSAVDGVCRLAYEKYGIRGLTANVLTSSTPALRCLAQAGFTEAFRREKVYALSEDESLDFLALMWWAEDSAKEADAPALPPEEETDE